MENKSKQNLQKSVSFLQDLLNNSSFAKSYTINTNTRKNWSITGGYTDNRSVTLSARPHDEKETAELDEIVKKVNQQLQSDPEVYKSLEDFEVDRGLPVGEKFPKYSKVNDVLKGGEGEIVHQEGEVILFDVWATWCGPCQRPMQHNQDMLEKNAEKWSNKVRIIAVSVDDDNETALKRINDKKWDKITHFRLNGWDGEHPIIKDFQIQGIPFVALVDKQGVLNFTGHPSSIDLEGRINSLLEAKGQGQGQQAQSQSEITPEQNKKGKTFLKNQLQQHAQSLGDNDKSFSYSMTQTNSVTIKPDSQVKNYGTLSYSASVEKKSVESYNKFKAHVQSVLGENYPLKKSREIIMDAKAGLNQDLKELTKIYEKYHLTSIENEFVVSFKQVYSGGKFVPSKEEHFHQHQKLQVEKDEKKEEISKASEEQSTFAINKFQSGAYAEYLRKMYQTGIRTTEEKQEKPKDHEDEYRKLKEIMQSKDLLEIDLQIKYDTKLKILLKRHRVFNYKGDMKYKYHSKAIIKYTVREHDKETMQKEVLDKIFAKFDKNLFEVKEKLLKAANIEEGKNCKVCNCELAIPYYFNYFQKEHYCIACGDKRDQSIKTLSQFAIPHNLVLINTTDKAILSDVDEYKLGKDVQPKPDKEIEFSFGYACNGCDEGGKNSRYICVSCRPGPYRGSGYIDFCYECLKKQVFDKDEEFIKRMETEQQHCANHVYLKVITPEGRYRDF